MKECVLEEIVHFDLFGYYLVFLSQCDVTDQKIDTELGDRNDQSDL